MNIALDGPAGAGKSTIAKRLASELKILYLDTGAMYRAAGYKAFLNNIDVLDSAACEKLLSNTKIDVVYQDGQQKIFIDDIDCTQKIREHYVSRLASDISKHQSVRVMMVELQRKIAKSADSVLDGRDIGTYVLPNAEYKFFVTADISERAKRRYNELKAKGEECSIAQIEADIAKRDYNDSHREFAPLKKAENAIEIDTTFLTIDEVCDKILSIIRG